MTISPMHFADVSRRTGLPLWNPDDPQYFVQDSALGTNPYMSDYIRFHIPFHGGVEKAVGDPSQYAGASGFSPEQVSPLRPEIGQTPLTPVTTTSPVARIKTGTTPGGMSGDIGDNEKIAMANDIHRALAIQPNGSSLLLSKAGIGPHRIRVSPGIGGWEENATHHMDPYFSVDVPADVHGNYDPRIGEILSHIFKQTALGTEQHVRVGQRPNAIGIRGSFDSPLGHHRGMELARKLIAQGQGFSPDVHHDDNFARAILYPGTGGTNVPEGIASLMAPYAPNARPENQTGQLLNYAQSVGEISPHHLDAVASAASAVNQILREHGARNSHIFGLRTGYGEFTPRPDVVGDPHVRDAEAAIANIRQQYRLKGVDTDVEKGADADKKVEEVMGEFKRGKLKSGSGKKVTSRDQAVAIALSEAGKSKSDNG